MSVDFEISCNSYFFIMKIISAIKLLTITINILTLFCFTYFFLTHFIRYVKLLTSSLSVS